MPTDSERIKGAVTENEARSLWLVLSFFFFFFLHSERQYNYRRLKHGLNAANKRGTAELDHYGMGSLLRSSSHLLDSAHSRE